VVGDSVTAEELYRPFSGRELPLAEVELLFEVSK
jgi:hypothetical protein